MSQRRATQYRRAKKKVSAGLTAADYCEASLAGATGENEKRTRSEKNGAYVRPGTGASA